MNARHGMLALVLAVTLAVAFWPERGDELNGFEVVQAEKRKKPTAAATTAAQGDHAADAADGAKVAERFGAQAEGDLFPRQTWVPPPPPPPKVKPLPPPPPRPPALPFGFLGKWAEQGRETIFLTQGDQVLQVHQGDVLAINWRLDQVTPQQMIFTYLPLDMTQTMRISP